MSVDYETETYCNEVRCSHCKSMNTVATFAIAGDVVIATAIQCCSCHILSTASIAHKPKIISMDDDGVRH